MQKKQSTRHEVMKEALRAMRSFTLIFRHLLDDELREDGVSLPQMRLLYAVREKVDVSSAELARTCEIAPQSMQALLQRAEREKWIKRSVSEKNHRIMTTKLTAKGEKLLQKAHLRADQIADSLWGDTPLQRIEEMTALLRASVERIDSAKQIKISSKKVSR